MKRIPPQLSKLVPVVIALIAAISVIVFIKTVLLPSVPQSTGSAAEIWMLEVVVILSVLGAFIYWEVLEGMQRILQVGQSSDKPHGDSHGVSPMTLVGSFGASVAIYLIALAWLKNVVVM